MGSFGVIHGRRGGGVSGFEGIFLCQKRLLRLSREVHDCKPLSAGLPAQPRRRSGAGGPGGHLPHAAYRHIPGRGCARPTFGST